MNAKTSRTLRTSRELFDSCLVLPLTVLLVSKVDEMGKGGLQNRRS